MGQGNLRPKQIELPTSDEAKVYAAKKETVTYHYSQKELLKPGNGQSDVNLMVYRQNSISLPRQITIEGGIGMSPSFDDDARFIAQTLDVLKDLSTFTGIKEPAKHLTVIEMQNSPNGYVKFQQTINGLRILNKQLHVHLNDQGGVSLINGNPIELPTVFDSKISIKSSDAYLLALNHLASLCTLDNKSFTNELLHQNDPELLVVEKKGKLVMGWRWSLCPDLANAWDIVLDANSGEIISSQNMVCHIDNGPVKTKAMAYDGKTYDLNSYFQGQYYMIDASRPMFDADHSVMTSDPKGVIEVLDARGSFGTTATYFTSSSPNWVNSKTVKIAASALINSGVVYDYFRNTQGFNSLDNKGMNISSLVNVDSESGIGYDNAYFNYNSNLMVYGNGQFVFNPLCADLSIVAHEMTHCVAYHSAHLGTKGEQGSINESFADIFGAVVSGRWKIGETALLNRQYYSQGNLRNLANPNNNLNKEDWGWGASNMSQYVEYTNANSNDLAIYQNSTILGNAFYLACRNHPQGVEEGKKVMSQLFFNALTRHLTPESDFYDVRNAVISEAEKNFGVNSIVANLVSESFESVGLKPKEIIINPNDLPSIIGDDYILTKSTNTEGVNSGLTVINGENFNEDTEKLKWIQKPLSRMSITDNGKFGYYVGQDRNVYQIQLDTISDRIINDDIVDNKGNWNNVAVSKYNHRLAIVKNELKPNLYVYSPDIQELAKFELEAGSEVTVNYEYYPLVPIRIGNLEWNIDGETIVFDLLTYYVNKNGDTNYVWDLAEIKVWNNEIGNFGEGRVQYKFEQRSSSLDLKNPTYAKNSPYIITYDEYDNATGLNNIIGMNLSTSETKVITSSTILGYPSYSSDDTKIVYNDIDNQGDTVLKIIYLNADKISVNQNSTPLLVADQRKQPVWFVQGEREVGIDKTDKFSFDIAVYPNPAQNQLRVSCADCESINYVSILNITGIEMMRINKIVNPNFTDLTISSLPKGAYFVKIQSNNGFVVKPFVKN